MGRPDSPLLMNPIVSYAIYISFHWENEANILELCAIIHNGDNS